MVFAAFVRRLKAMVGTRNAADSARFDDVLTMLERDAGLKGNMLDELREAAHVGRLPLYQSSHVDLAELVRSTIEALSPLAGERAIMLRAQCAASSVIIAADARDLTSIVGRLLSCAIAAGARGSTVDCQLSLDPNRVRLVARVDRSLDAGPLARVFESSCDSRSKDDSSVWEHSGLATVRTLVELYGGIVRVDTRGPGRESIFAVTLPGNPEPDTPAASNAATR
jgi:signal transduction histidine kinase